MGCQLDNLCRDFCSVCCPCFMVDPMFLMGAKPDTQYPFSGSCAGQAGARLPLSQTKTVLPCGHKFGTRVQRNHRSVACPRGEKSFDPKQVCPLWRYPTEYKIARLFEATPGNLGIQSHPAHIHMQIVGTGVVVRGHLAGRGSHGVCRHYEKFAKVGL